MTISTRDQLIDALANNSSRIVIDKASLANAAAGQIFSLWRATGVPGQGAIPGAAALCDGTALTGAIGFSQQIAPNTSYLGWLRLLTGNATTTTEIHDRLAHMGGLNGTLTTAQTVGIDASTIGISAARRGDANFSDLQWFIEIYADLGATGVNATVAVTYDDASTGNLAAIALGATPRAGRLYQLVPAVAGRFIRAVTSVTLSATTGAAGSFGVTCTRPRTGIDTLIANKAEAYDWAQLGLPEVPNGACLQLITVPSTTSTGIFRGQGKIAHG